MGIKNNFISIITLGNFNPAILTPPFIIEHCGLKTTTTPKGQTSPVASFVEFGDISFLAELEKFQIMEKNLSDFKENNVINLVSNYLEKLRFTPIFVMGINFNAEITAYSEKAEEVLNNRKSLMKLLDAKELIFSTKEKLSEETSTLFNWDITKKADPITRLTLSKNLETNSFTMNYNVEVRNIQSDRDRMNLIRNNIDSLLKEFNKYVEVLLFSK